MTIITVKELREALEELERAGYGDAPVKTLDRNDNATPVPSPPWWSAYDQAVVL